jgi:hypothetical protein
MQKKIVLALLLVCGTAQASNWMKIPRSATATGADYIDMESIKTDGAMRRAWIKTVFLPNTMKGLSPRKTMWVSLVMSLLEFNCSEESSRSLSFTGYYTDNDKITVNSPSAWQPVAPDTVDQARFDFVCHPK